MKYFLNVCQFRRIKAPCYRNKHELAKDIIEKRAVELSPLPSFIQERLEIWDQLKIKYDQERADKKSESIKVTLLDGKVTEAQSWRTTPLDIARQISPSLADKCIIAKVNNVLWDLTRPFENTCHLQLHNFDHEESKQVFWHSTSHILGEALERFYGGLLCYGPPIENGYYYDTYMVDNQTVSSKDFPLLESVMKSIVKEKQPFERMEINIEDLRKMFQYNPFKQRILNEKVTTPTATVYRCGSLIDLCRGPHVIHTGVVKAFQITKNSSAFWQGKSVAESLQRVYGISFPDNKQLKDWNDLQEEAKKRNHRKIGRDQELFFFNKMVPGICSFHPKGAHIYETLVDLMKSEYKKRGFQTVITPEIVKASLLEQSGHLELYSDDMFKLEIEKDTYALKPMNCPLHCLMFNDFPRSWKELPLRLADFGVLHRNEASGALSGLTRVREFRQDDAHIFCTSDQITQEISGALDFLKYIYGILGLTYHLKLSTRPEKYLGEAEMWDKAEKQLTESLNLLGEPWSLNPGDGAFYGPKIDISIMDALQRSWQCATIQLDFQLPARFELSYSNERGEQQVPVMIHRAILGSIERMIAILIENYGGKWPFWLSPRQAIVVPVFTNPSIIEYCNQVKAKLQSAGFLCDVEIDSSNTLNKKIRNSQLAQYNFILVVGEKEMKSEAVNVRTRDNKVFGTISVEDVITKFTRLQKDRVLKSEEMF